MMNLTIIFVVIFHLIDIIQGQILIKTHCADHSDVVNKAVKDRLIRVKLHRDSSGINLLPFGMNSNSNQLYPNIFT